MKIEFMGDLWDDKHDSLFNSDDFKPVVVACGSKNNENYWYL